MIKEIDAAILATDVAKTLSRHTETTTPADILQEIQNQLTRQGFADGEETEIRLRTEQLLSDDEFIKRIYFELKDLGVDYELPDEPD